MTPNVSRPATDETMEGPSRPEEGEEILAIILGVEGEVINTEDLHYRKWKIQAMEKMHVIGSDAKFENFWRSEGIGIGDKALYEKLKGRASQTEFPKWEIVEEQVNKFYRANIHLAEIPEGFARACRAFKEIEKRQNKEILFMFLTHAEEPLITLQLNQIQQKTSTEVEIGIAFDAKKDVIYHERKDKEGYRVALTRINEIRAQKGLDPLKPQNVLVLDSKKYRSRAEELGFKAMTIALVLGEHLLPLPKADNHDPESLKIRAMEEADEKAHTVKWCGVYGLIAGKGKDYYSAMPSSSGPSPH